MLRLKMTLLAFSVVAVPMLASVQSAEAGPLLDWIRNRCRRNTCATQTCGQPAMVAANSYGLQPGQCMKTCNQTCARTVVNYVPHTAYRTEWKRIPVTQYKPVTNSDPCTGCTVTCMRPCTTYSYQCQRVPYTTYRPEYRTETYSVPVTTITNDCATGNCGVAADCPTCVAPSAPSATPNFAPGSSDGTYYEYPTNSPPRGAVINPSGSSFNATVPADQSPSLSPQSSTKPYSNQFRTEPTPAYDPTANRNYSGYVAQTPARKEFSYSPSIRTASYVSSKSIAKPTENRSISNLPTRTTNQRDDLNGWKVVK